MIVRDDSVVGDGWNEVLHSNDPTAHALTIEFRDELIYEELAKPVDKRALRIERVRCDGALDVFATWSDLAGRVTCRADEPVSP